MTGKRKKGEEMKGSEKRKHRVRQEDRGTEGGKDGVRAREGEKGTCRAEKEEGKGAKRDV